MTAKPPWRIVAARTAAGLEVTRHQLTVLQALADCGQAGSCAVHGVMDGGTLAALVQLGLAERIPHQAANDGLGGCRYRALPEGPGQPLKSASAARTGGRR